MITCVGSVFIDRVIKVNNIPHKPIKIIGHKIEKRLGGSATIASFTIAKLGACSEFVGRFGSDSDLKFIKSEFNKFNISFAKSQVIKNAHTSQSHILEDIKGERLLAAYNDKKLFLKKKLPKFIFSKKHTYLTDLRWLDASLYVSQKCNKMNINCIADIDNFNNNNKIKRIVHNASHVIFSENGLQEFTKIKSIQKSLRYLYRKKNKFYAVTLGDKGVCWIENNIIYYCSALKVKAIETNGAGDVFHGAFAAFIHQKKTIQVSVELATATASLKCTKAGGIRSLPNYKSVKQFVKKIKTSVIR